MDEQMTSDDTDEESEGIGNVTKLDTGTAPYGIEEESIENTDNIEEAIVTNGDAIKDVNKG